MSSTSAESSFSASEGTSSQATPETSDVFSEITEFFTENQEIFIKTGIGTGGFLLGIILMLIVSKCKRKKETEVSNTSNNGVITNGRTQEEMDSLLQKYINDANTMKKQWQNTSSQIYTSQQHASYVEDDLPLQSMDIVHISHQESTVNYPSANEQVPQSEYTNSGVVQSYRDEDINGANEGTARGENYFLLQKDFVEINGMHNETVPHGYSADNYFLLEKDFVEGTDLQDLEDQSQFTVM
ncbi:uncharacterized protein LOC133187834 [Saccostrea echinata]|uniref:uncharacterized protein LOC133187834 n=1 Tax=Saccostrea echinata TaxID=191078 RepID=UPI002A814CDD|nr:uncharacterized protein LOC133187834 [Saccostrea echinata]